MKRGTDDASTLIRATSRANNCTSVSGASRCVTAAAASELHFYRTVKLGEGVARTEIEEETTQAIFDVLWPLTKGRRLRKRRFEVTVDGVIWEIDEFKHRDLVMAEIELDTEDDAVVYPDWLAPAVQREVTKEPEFQNINLAR